MDGDVLVSVEGRRLKLSNLDKVLYPSDGFTKGEVINYYSRIARLLLPHVTGRPLTMRRYPNGVEGASFYEKNAARHAPDWVRTVSVETPGSTTGAETLDFAVVDDLATLVWVANLASLELHIPQWTVGPRGGKHPPDRLVFDLDPGAPATIVECCRVALLLRDELAAAGLEPVAKSSGSKGMQLYCAITTSAADAPSGYAKALAEKLATAEPSLVVAKMAKNLRPHKVFIDWSQNNQYKTTVAPYSLRARERPTVSTPITWREVERCRRPEDLVFTADDVLDRVDKHGDLFEPLLTEDPPKLPARL
jgi:bifunctional non-homologous end joining protein LigD